MDSPAARLPNVKSRRGYVEQSPPLATASQPENSLASQKFPLPSSPARPPASNKPSASAMTNGLSP